MVFKRFIGKCGALCIVTVLVFGMCALAGCAGASNGAAGQDASAQKQDAGYTADVPSISGEELLAAFSSDERFASYAQLVGGIDLSIDESAQQVVMTVQAATSDVPELCAAGEAVAQCLSIQARVTNASGAEVSSGDTGPCGALFQVYDLSVRMQGIGENDVVDGLLHAGDTEMMWQ